MKPLLKMLHIFPISMTIQIGVHSVIQLDLQSQIPQRWSPDTTSEIIGLNLVNLAAGCGLSLEGSAIWLNPFS